MSTGRRPLKAVSRVSLHLDDAMFENLSPAGRQYACKKLSRRQEGQLLKYWPIKNHDEVAEALGISTTTALKYYRRLLRARENRPGHAARPQGNT